jgi:hypothetical protein
VEESDVDLGVIASSFDYQEEGYDTHSWTPEYFISRFSCPVINWVTHQWLFPAEFLLENDLSKWIQENREEFVKAILPEFYNSHLLAINRFLQRGGSHNKYVARAIHFRNMFANYAEGMTFEEALKPQGANRDFLLDIRKGKVPVSQILNANATAKARLLSVEDFYKEPRADKSILKELEYMVYREVELLK